MTPEEQAQYDEIMLELNTSEKENRKLNERLSKVSAKFARSTERMGNMRAEVAKLKRQPAECMGK